LSRKRRRRRVVMGLLSLSFREIVRFSIGGVGESALKKRPCAAARGEE
jgi:hypothetical protein